jgi:hypothetical protein
MRGGATTVQRDIEPVRGSVAPVAMKHVSTSALPTKRWPDTPFKGECTGARVRAER